MSDRKFFKKSVQPSCGYCQNGKVLGDGSEVFCIKKGIMNSTDSCRGYKYDVLKREPKIKTIADDYKAEDFKL